MRRYGPEAIASGSALHQAHIELLDWAGGYDTGGPEMRSRAMHEAWLSNLPCATLRLDGDRPVAEQLVRIEAFRGKGGGVGMATTVPLSIEIQTQSATEIVDVTERVGAAIGGAADGSCHLYLRHTTAGLMIVTGEDGVPEDVMDILQTLTPKLAYRHASPAHVAAHFLSALVGPSVCVPVRDGKLALGQFQRIMLTEFEGPRTRVIEVRLLAAGASPE